MGIINFTSTACNLRDSCIAYVQFTFRNTYIAVRHVYTLYVPAYEHSLSCFASRENGNKTLLNLNTFWIILPNLIINNLMRISHQLISKNKLVKQKDVKISNINSNSLVPNKKGTYNILLRRLMTKLYLCVFSPIRFSCNSKCYSVLL